MSGPKLSPARQRGLQVLLADHWRPSAEGVRESNSTSPIDDGEAAPNGWGELRVYWQVLAWLRDHDYVELRPGSADHYRLTPAGLELAQSVAGHEVAP